MISSILQLLEMEKEKIATLIGSLQATATSLLALLQLYGKFVIKISQEERKKHYLIANLVSSQNMTLEKIRRTRYRYLYFYNIYRYLFYIFAFIYVCSLFYPETVTGIFLETKQSYFWPNPLKIVS